MKGSRHAENPTFGLSSPQLVWFNFMGSDRSIAAGNGDHKRLLDDFDYRRHSDLSHPCRLRDCHPGV